MCKYPSVLVMLGCYVFRFYLVKMKLKSVAAHWILYTPSQNKVYILR